MRKLLAEIHAQPEEVRLVIFWLCVVTCSALVGFVWFRSTESRLVALMEAPAPVDNTINGFAFIPLSEPANSAVAQTEATGFWSGLAGAGRLLRASIGELFGGNDLDLNNGAVTNGDSTDYNNTQPLPLSGDK